MGVLLFWGEAPPPPSGLTVGVPTVTVDMALGSNPGDSSYVWTNVHSDAGVGRVRSFSYSRGGQNELDAIQTGVGGLLLKDSVSDFDPDNPGGTFSSNVRPYVPVRVQATIDGSTFQLFQHYVERWPRTKRVTSVYTERGIETVDGFEWLARSGIKGANYPEQTSGARFNAVLDTIGWPQSLRSVDTGNSTVDAASFDDNDTTNALQHLTDVANTENGLFYIDGYGRVLFVERHRKIVAPYTVSQAEFHDGDGGSGFPYVDLVPSFDVDTTFNEWVGTREGGVPQVTADATSQVQYGLRTKQVASFANSDVEVLAQMEWKLSLFKDPLNRIQAITLMPGHDVDFWKTVLALDVGDRITVRETPPGYGAAQSSDYLIQRLNVVFAGAVQATTVTFGVWPATTATWLILDDPLQGKLDTGKLGY